MPGSPVDSREDPLYDVLKLDSDTPAESRLRAPVTPQAGAVISVIAT